MRVRKYSLPTERGALYKEASGVYAEWELGVEGEVVAAQITEWGVELVLIVDEDDTAGEAERTEQETAR